MKFLKNIRRFGLLLLFVASGSVLQAQSNDLQNIMPEYPGGQQALAKFMYSNMHYPDKAQRLGITGLVRVQFTVLPSGKIINARLIKDIGGGCGAEAMRLVSLMPSWIPGRIDGKPASISVTLPVVFDLRETKIKRKKISRKERRRLRKAGKAQR